MAIQQHASKVRDDRSRGMALIYVAMVIVALMGFVSLAVDLGRVHLAKTELRCAADSAALAGVASLISGVTSAQTAASTYASANSVDGSSLTLDTANDIEFGTWDTSGRTFAVLTGSNRTSANAMRVTARRTAARGNAIPLMFAQSIGLSTCDVTVTAIAYSPGRKAELVGTSSIEIKNNFFGGTYHSGTTTAPTRSTILNGATAGSNGAITTGSNESLDAAILGPSGTSDMSTANATVRLTSNMSFAIPSGGTTTTDWTVSGTQTKAGGTHYINDLAISNGGVLRFSGAAVVYLSGNVKFIGDATITAYNSVPGDLKIYHTGTGSFGSNTANDSTITADVYAPGVDFVVKNNAVLTGRFIFKSVVAKNNLDFYYDTALPPIFYTGTSSAVQLVK